MGGLFSGMKACTNAMQAYTNATGACSQNLGSAGAIAGKERSTFMTTLVGGEGAGGFTPAGVASSSVNYINGVGTASTSKIKTNMAIGGQGMFITCTTADGPSGGGKTGFTRVGTFKPDLAGNIVNHLGQYLQVWTTDGTGTPTSPDTANLSGLQTATVSGLSGNPKVTSNITLPLSLAGDAPIGAASVETTVITVVDSLGTPQQLTLKWQKTAQTPTVSQTWNLSVTSPSGGTVAAPYSTPGISIIFDTAGYPISYNGAALPPALVISAWTNASAASSITLDMGTGSLGVVANRDGSGVRAIGTDYVPGNIVADGYLSGNLSDVSVDRNGLLLASFDNGQTLIFGRVPLATFPAVNEMSEQSGGMFYPTTESGSYTLNFAGKGAAGAIAPSSLEDSTVDGSSDIVQLIVYSKYFGFNVKGVSIAKEMTDALDRIG